MGRWVGSTYDWRRSGILDSVPTPTCTFLHPHQRTNTKATHLRVPLVVVEEHPDEGPARRAGLEVDAAPAVLSHLIWFGIYVRGVDKSNDGGMCGRCPRRPPPPDDQPDIPIDSSTPHAAATTTYRPRDGHPLVQRVDRPQQPLPALVDADVAQLQVPARLLVRVVGLVVASATYGNQAGRFTVHETHKPKLKPQTHAPARGSTGWSPSSPKRAGWPASPAARRGGPRGSESRPGKCTGWWARRSRRRPGAGG